MAQACMFSSKEQGKRMSVPSLPLFSSPPPPLQAEFYDEVVLTGLDYFPGYKFSRLFFQPTEGKPFNEIANKYLIYGNQPWPHDASTCSDPSHHHERHQEEDPMEQSRVEVSDL
jgi:hypothetical protein